MISDVLSVMLLRHLVLYRSEMGIKMKVFYSDLCFMHRKIAYFTTTVLAILISCYVLDIELFSLVSSVLQENNVFLLTFPMLYKY